MEEDRPPDEFNLIRRLTSGLPQGEGVRVSIGDDGAVLTPPRGELVMATDLMAEGVHFDRRYTSARDIGHKALAVNLSDLAAMGAVPRYALLAMALPVATAAEDAAQILEGLTTLAAAHGVALIGGDTTACRPGAMTLTVTVVGSADGVEPVTRRGAMPGDWIAVCGELGAAGHALSRLSAGEAPGPWALPLFRPAPQVAAGRWLATRGCPTSMIDVSDGLLADLGHLLAGGELGAPALLGAKLSTRSIPLSAHLSGLPDDVALSAALVGGEDYALLFTLPPGRAALLRDDDAPKVSLIGTITREPGLSWDPPDAAPAELGPGFQHFARGAR